MGDLERYIVEEWAEDYEDGRLNRREFLRRVALMAGGTAVALPVLSQLGVTATLQEVAAASAGTPVPQAGPGGSGRSAVAQALGVTVPPDDPALEGGMVTFPMGTSNPSLRAAVPFYGPNPPLEDVPKIKAAVLAIYGELDTRIDAGIPAIREAMQRAGITHEIVIYPGANHAFFNDTGERYHDVSAKDAWQRAVAWFGRYLRQ